MHRGEVWRVRLPFTGGHAQAGLRPAVIVQHDRHTAVLPTVLVVPFTSSLKTQAFPGTVLVQPDGQNGLTVPSVALGFQLRVIDQRDAVQRLGSLDPQALAQVLAAVDALIR
jgi:mRNA interferase MazF